MNPSRYDVPSDAMMTNARKWLELAVHDDREFQRQLSVAKVADTIGFEDAMTLAHAALIVADNCALQSFAPWYRECASSLFCRAYDAIAFEREARAAAEAGRVQ